MLRSFGLGPFSKIAVKTKKATQLTLTCVAVLPVRLRKPHRRGAASHYDTGGVKGARRALRVGSSKISRVLGAPAVVEANQRSSRAMGGFDAGYVRVGGPVEHDE